MKISELFKGRVSDSSANPAKGASHTHGHHHAKSANQQPAPGEDTVSISNLARQYAQISQVVQEDDNQHQARVDDIKQKVANGTYSVSSSDVAASIVDYLKQ